MASSLVSHVISEFHQARRKLGHADCYDYLFDAGFLSRLLHRRLLNRGGEVLRWRGNIKQNMRVNCTCSINSQGFYEARKA